MADISVDLDRYIVNKKIIKNHFRIGINGRNGGKHRYGPMGDDITTLWKYAPGGAECISRNRERDNSWCVGHKVRMRESAPLCHTGAGVLDEVSGSLLFMPDPEFFKKKVCK